MRFGTFSYNQARPWVPERQAFEELLEQIQLTERLGFDEAWFAEHHHSDYGMLASPNLIIATLAPRTQRLRLGNLVNVLPLYDPMRLAEECGMLDILTGGRLNVGTRPRRAPRRHQTSARSRYRSGALRGGHRDSSARLDRRNLQLRGKAWDYVEISCRPLPLQRPHPPIYYGATSPESPAMVARRGWNLALSRQPLANCAQAIKSYRAERAALATRTAATRSWCATFTSPIPTSKHGRRLPRKSPASGNWPRDNVWRGDSISPEIFRSSPSATPIFPAV